jgi:hypothetical protein
MSEVMEGGGRYNANASAQAAAATYGIDRLADAARTAPIGPAGAVTVVDYGCSEGANSMAPMRAVVAAARSTRGAQQPVWVFHTDLPDNDFGSLFSTVADDPSSYRGPGVHTAVIGRSFYEQLLPNATVSIGWSSIAVHWLSSIPGALDGFWFAAATADQYETWRRAAAADWREFLAAREAEMMSGATLVVVVGAAHGDGRQRRSGAERAMDELAAGMDSLIDRGMLTVGECEAMIIPAWYRTADEWRAPFDAGCGLSLDDLQVIDLGDPLWEQAHPAAGEGPDGGSDDYPARVAAALRVSFGPSLLGGVEPERRATVAADLFDRHLAGAIAAAQPEPWFTWRLAVLTISKPRWPPEAG